uniref:Uncharacterized protein n=1 Tax=Ciona savignyi TaxID=51511 RepID=H2Z058_CIOSA
MHTLSLMHTGWFVGKQVKIISIKQVCKVLEPATVVTKRTFLYSKKSNENFCEAVPDNIQMRRSQCINELCNYYVNSPNYIANEDPGVDSWAHHFIRASHVLENYLLLRHHKGAKTLMHRFAYIDPDRCEKSPPDSELAPQKSKHQHQPIEELSFMTQFAFTLK